jgi:aldehyde:ferredoxin oxidoreductase
MAVGGVWGKLLHVDLADGRHWIEEPADEIYLKLLGGRGLVAYLLLRDLPVGIDPLGPENLLIFAPGILQGSNLPGAGRHGVGAKSPLTGAIASAESGGWWGHEFKRTGYDALIVHGKAEKPVYLWIKDGAVEIRGAEHLWGKDTADVEWAIQGELDDKRIRVSQCGIAGENGVLFANIVNDINRAAGRGGLGAVMGSKNLRAVAVRGNLNIPVSERKRVTGISKWLGDNYKTKAASFVAIGTPGNVNSLAPASALPTHNFQDPFFPQHKSISGQLMQETILIGRDTCQACPISCKQVVEYEDQEYAENPYLRSDFLHKLKISKEYGGPEYESIAALGSACGVDDFIAIAKANEHTARWAMDSISLGMTIAFVMECVERELLTAEQTSGFLPRFGSAADMLQAVEMIARGEGFGAQMGQGSKRLAAWIGDAAAESLVEVKGQELPMHEPRAKHALGIGYAVAPVGADHMMNMHDTGFAQPGDGLERVAEIKRFEPMPFNYLGDEKMDLFYHEVNRKHMLDSAVICHFLPYYPSHLAEVLAGVTGHEFTPQELLTVGERAQTLSRLFNLREGFSAEDDRLPRRVMKAFVEGPLAGVEITDEAFFHARNHWYSLMGWTEEGVPTAERLQTLGLSQILADTELEIAV